MPLSPAPPAPLDADLSALYEWVDTIPLSRPRRNLARDFADAVPMAEVCHYFFPKHVDLHNYSPASCTAGRLYNWTTLREKVLTPLSIPVTRGDIEAAAAAAPGAAEWVLALVRRRAGGGDRPPPPVWRGRVVERGGWRTAGVTTGSPARPSPGGAAAARHARAADPCDVERPPPADADAAPSPSSDDPVALRRTVAKLERALVGAEARIEELSSALAAATGGGGGRGAAGGGAAPGSPKARLVACLSPRRGGSPVKE